MNLKLIIAGRHGDYGNGPRSLTTKGTEQSQKFAAAVKSIVASAGKITLLTSPFQRALETAEIVGKEIGVVPEQCWALRAGDYAFQEPVMHAILELAADSDVVVAITHLETPSGIMNAFSSSYFQRPFEKRVSENGAGLVLFMATGEIRAIP